MRELLTPKAILAGVDFTGSSAASGSAQARQSRAAQEPAATAEESLAELRELTGSAGAEVVDCLLQRRPRPDPATWMGAGKVAELQAAAAAQAADLAIVDGELSPTQQRNLERALGIPVLARTQLILDIFARHARTREGQLQVELAQLEYLLPRLAGRGHQLSRLGGGIGTRGPGETQLETDRRRIHHRIGNLRLALERVRAHRGQQRQKRLGVPLATVALVGYTNAGKSTLFNQLTGAGVATSARMFATLDPTLRALRLPSRRRVVLSDTVGFLRDLPHALISAFRATLEEVTRASLLVLVSDVHAPHRQRQEEEVGKVLRELGVEATPQIRVWNKADLLTEPPPELARPAGDGADAPDEPERRPPLLVSARTGFGLDALLRRLDRELPLEPMEQVRLHLPYAASQILHLLHQHGEILAERHAERRIELVARVPVSLIPRIQAYRVLNPSGTPTVENP